MKRVLSSLAALTLASLLSACASSDPNGLNDPYESTNRSTFALDQGLDRSVARPVAVFYRDTFPWFVRDGVHNVLANLNSPVIFANDILQGSPVRAGETLGRAIINTTVGLGGLIDVASKQGLKGHDEDFGQTLGVWGAGEGPYLVLPLAGPSNPRDLAGTVADNFLDPATYARFPGFEIANASRFVMNIVDMRERNIDTLDQIERTSVDLYATTRSLYRQHRNSEIRNGAPDTDNLPNL